MQYIFLYIFIIIFSFAEVLSAPNVKLGIDSLVASDFAALKGKKTLLLCNNASRTGSGESTLSIFKKQKNIDLVGILTPEHGYYTTLPAGKTVKDDKIEGVQAYSLYKNSKEADNKVLALADVIVVDIQDIGIRSYTYLSSVYKVMEACAEHSIPIIILDRPNPLGGVVVDGGIVEPELTSYVSIAPVSYLHGCTIGELANIFNEENWLKKGGSKKCKLTIIPMKGWKRNMSWEETGLQWFPTSPHIPTVDAVRGAAVLGVFGELGIISIGIGTTMPFQYVGKPGLNPDYLQKIITEMKADLSLSYVEYQPFYGMYSGNEVAGLMLKFNNPVAELYSAGFKIMLSLRKKYPGLFNMDNIKPEAKKMFSKVTGSSNLLKMLQTPGNDTELLEEIQKGKTDFLKIRQKYLLYD